MSRRISHLGEIELRHQNGAEIYRENESFSQEREIYALAKTLNKSSYPNKKEVKSLLEKKLNQQFNICNHEAKSS